MGRAGEGGKALLGNRKTKEESRRKSTYFIPIQLLDPREKLTIYCSSLGSPSSQRSGRNSCGEGNTEGFMLWM